MTPRRIALNNTELASAACATIRLELFKIGADVFRNSRRIRLLLSSRYPYQALFPALFGVLILVLMKYPG